MGASPNISGAYIASARLGVKRFKELLDRYGKDLVFAACNQLMDYSETMLRQRISAIPNGEYRAEGWLDDDGRNRGQHLPVKVCVRVIDDRIEVDLTIVFAREHRAVGEMLEADGRELDASSAEVRLDAGPPWELTLRFAAPALTLTVRAETDVANGLVSLHSTLENRGATAAMIFSPTR